MYNQCLECENGQRIVTTCSNSINDCLYQTGNKCMECNDGFYLSNKKCVKDKNNTCLKETSKGCFRCIDGFYVDNNECKQCDSNCKTCFGNSTNYT